MELPELPEIPDFLEPLELHESEEGLFQNAAAFLGSFILHLLVLLALILITTPVRERGTPVGVVDGELLWDDAWWEPEDVADVDTDVVLEPEEAPPAVALEHMPDAWVEELPADPLEHPDFEDLAPTPDPQTEDGSHTTADEYAPETLQTGTENATETGTGTDTEAYEPAFPETGTLDGRTNLALRQRLLGDGGTAESEMAVERGLKWIYAHQMSDRDRKSWGSWNFNLGRVPYCDCRNSGESSSTTGATALALLAFLGHGNTREQGEYRAAVGQGLYYLSTRAMRRKGIPGLDLREGTVYGHALATLAICEALAMEEKRDKGLEALAKGAVEWILYAQDPVSGGWRYEPREKGDVTVTAWMIMALKSAKMAGVEIPSTAIVKIDQFLDSVSVEERRMYAYQQGGEVRRSTTAIGLVARMFLGAPHGTPYLRAGTNTVADWGYSGSDLYYDYYATLLLRHYGGPRWEAWNTEMRDYLIATQSRAGHESGSWYFDEEHKIHNQTGGRLYTTAMSVMILEVYYRYLPIYKPESTGGTMY